MTKWWYGAAIASAMFGHTLHAAERIDEVPSAVTTVGAEELENTPSRSITDLIGDETMIITATRGARDRFTLPFSAETVGRKQLDDRMYRTVPQSLRDIPGIMVQETSPGQGSPFIRGFTGRQNVFLIDGIRLNNSTNRGGPMQYWNTVDPFSIERLEVVKGPGSVMYGSDAIGGVVNAITKNPYGYDADGAGLGYGARGYFRGATAENSLMGRGEVSLGIDEHTGFLGGLTGKNFEDVYGGRHLGNQPHTGYDEYDADFKVEHFFNPDTRLVIAHQRVRQNNVPRTHRYAEATTFHGTTTGSDHRLEYDEERELTYVQFHAENVEGAFFDTLRASLSWQRAEEVEDRVRGTGVASMRGFEVGTLGFFIQLESETPIGRLTYGLDFYHDDIDSWDTTNPIQGSVGDDATYDMLGIFIQDDITIAERWHLLLGGRFTQIVADADSVEDPAAPGNTISIHDSFTNFSGSARLLYEIVPDHMNIYGGVSQGFRAPNIEDVSSLNIARSGEQAIPSPGLDPEHFISYEVGIKGRNDRFFGEVAYFYTDIDDLIVSRPTGAISGGGDIIVAKQNASGGFVNGIEASATYEIRENVFLFGNITWQDGEVDGDYLSRVMPLTGQVGVRARSGDHRLWGEIQLLMADKADHLSPGDVGDTQRIPPGGTPGYAILNLRGGYRVSDNVDLTLAVENVTNTAYRIHGSGSNMPGLNVIFGAVISF